MRRNGLTLGALGHGGMVDQDSGAAETQVFCHLTTEPLDKQDVGLQGVPEPHMTQLQGDGGADEEVRVEVLVEAAPKAGLHACRIQHRV